MFISVYAPFQCCCTKCISGDPPLGKSNYYFCCYFYSRRQASCPTHRKENVSPKSSAKNPRFGNQYECDERKNGKILLTIITGTVIRKYFGGIRNPNRTGCLGIPLLWILFTDRVWPNDIPRCTLCTTVNYGPYEQTPMLFIDNKVKVIIYVIPFYLNKL